MTTVSKDGKIGSSGPGLDGLVAAFRSLGNLLFRDIPRMLAAIARIGN
jgi:hypothetical protein